MSPINSTDSPTHPIPDSSWDQLLFPPTSNMETFTPNYPHHANPPSPPYSVRSIGSTSSQPTNYALGMGMSQDFAPKNGQLCFPTHQVFEHPLTSHTPAVSLKYQYALLLCVLICVSLFRFLSLPIIPNLRVIGIGRIFRCLPGTFLFQVGCKTHATSIWSVMEW